MRPQKLKEIVGQTTSKKVIDTLIKSATIRNDSCPHIVLFGPSGCGKTTIARAIAHELKSNFFEVNGASLKKISDLKDVVTEIKSGTGKDVLFIDEIHSVSDRVCEWLYTVMEDFSFSTKKGKKITIPKFTIIGATTELGKIPEPLRNRFKYECELEKYTIDELVEIAKRISIAGVKQLPDDVARIIAKTCRSTPRLVINRSEFIRDYMLANKVSKMNKDKLLEVIALQGIDENGLTKLDHRYLDEVSRGPISLRNLSGKLNTAENTLLNKIEPYLLEMQLIEITRGGRVKIQNDDWMEEL